MVLPENPEASCLMTVYAFPPTRHDKSCGVDNEIIRLRVSVAPVDGKVNSRCIDLLASRLSVPVSSVEIVRGKSSKIKSSSIQWSKQKTILKRLAN